MSASCRITQRSAYRKPLGESGKGVTVLGKSVFYIPMLKKYILTGQNIELIHWPAKLLSA